MVALAAIVPGADLSALQLARIESRNHVHLARRTEATWLAGHRVVRPRVVAT